MFKKSILIFIFLLLLGFSNVSFAGDAEIVVEGGGCALGVCNDAEGNQISVEEAVNQGYADPVDEVIESAEEAADKEKAAKEEKARDDACKDSKSCIDKASFEIKVDSISPGMNHIKGDTNKTINFALGTIIQKLMIGLGSLSLLIMTVGAGYIVLHGGQDELLNKGKSIFMSGIYAMLVALSSYYLIVIVRYVLYA